MDNYKCPYCNKADFYKEKIQELETKILILKTERDVDAKRIERYNNDR